MTARLPTSRDNTSLDPATARLLGTATLCLAALAAALQLRRVARPATKLASAEVPLQKSVVPDQPEDSATAPAARGLHAAAALLATSVLADSAVEHYRSEFENPGMFTPLLTSLMTLCAGASGAASPSGRSRVTRNGIYGAAVGVGLAGTAFHVYNVVRRPGGINWLNLFYAAPIGAPAALSLAGLIGLAARRIRNTPTGSQPRLLGVPAGRALTALTALGLAGTSSEAGLLHFRGAFHNPFMWLPVSVPPVASALLGLAAVRPVPNKPRWLTRAWLSLTGLLGIGGIGFHAYGVGRQMGGWRNARQNVLSGPPLSAPPSYTALALAGMAALSLLKRENMERLAT